MSQGYLLIPNQEPKDIKFTNYEWDTFSSIHQNSIDRTYKELTVGKCYLYFVYFFFKTPNRFYALGKLVKKLSPQESKSKQYFGETFEFLAPNGESFFLDVDGWNDATKATFKEIDCMDSFWYVAHNFDKYLEYMKRYDHEMRYGTHAYKYTTEWGKSRD